MTDAYALVAYLPEPWSDFLDGLGRSLSPDIRFRSHVTVLAPRPLRSGPAEAVSFLGERLSQASGFNVTLGEVAVFPGTSVLYISLREGSERLVALHDGVNQGPLAYVEPFPFHPHITLAQGLRPSQAQHLQAEAQRYLSAWGGSRTFPCESLSFIQRVTESAWDTLAEYALKRVPVAVP